MDTLQSRIAIARSQRSVPTALVFDAALRSDG